MDTCAAGNFCQLYHDNDSLRNGHSRLDVECEFCLQWYHSECVTFNPEYLELTSSQPVCCGCHLLDVFEGTL